MTILNFTETVAKSRTLGGQPCILVERETPNSSGRTSESETLAVFKDDEVGNAIADELANRLNHGKVRL